MSTRQLIILGFLICIVTALFAGAVTLYDVKFSTGTAHEQINLVAKTNYTLYIDVPKAYLNNITLNLIGVPS